MSKLTKDEYKLLKLISKSDTIPLDHSENLNSLLDNGYIKSYVDINNYLSPIRFYGITSKGRSELEERYHSKLVFIFVSILLPIIFMFISYYFFK